MMNNKPLIIQLRYCLAFILLASSLFGCSQTAIEIDNAYVPVRSEAQKHFVAYFDISNNTNTDVQLNSISSSQFKNVMLHETRHENGIAKMRHLESLKIAAKTTEKLEPNGKHLMLMMPTEKIWDRDSVEIQLHFSDGSTLDRSIPVRKKSSQ